MKGTIFSADFVKDANGDFKLLEINTDTGFSDIGAQQVDLSGITTIINDNSITEVHVQHKNFHFNFVEILQNYISTNHPSVNFETTLEESNVIYPTSITDSNDKLIIRLCYDEGAVLDSTYAASTENLFKLFVDNSSGSLLPEFYVSSSDWQYNNLDSGSIISSSVLPDFVVKPSLTNNLNIPYFIKLGQPSNSVADRVNGLINAEKADAKIIQKYYNTSEGTQNVKSFRSFQMAYGTDLNLLELATYKIDSILDLPTSLLTEINNDILVNKLGVHHHYEYATNELKVADTGLLSDELILSASGESVLIQNVTVGDVMHGQHVSGSPDTDNFELLRAWSYPGNELPAGSTEVTSSVVSIIAGNVDHNVITNIQIGSGSFRVSPYTSMLAYDSGSNEIKYRSPYEMNTTDWFLFNRSGSVVGIDTLEIEFLSGSYTEYTIDLEPNDTFFIGDEAIGTTKLIMHNCFAAGTHIALANGDHKNIEDIVVGEEVLTYNEETGASEAGTVGELKQHEVDSVIRLTLENSIVIVTTAEHPFYVNNKGWVKAGDLEMGDECKKVDGSDSFISTVEELKEVHTVYNLLSVSDNHNFYANGILVHNK